MPHRDGGALNGEVNKIEVLIFKKFIFLWWETQNIISKEVEHDSYCAMEKTKAV